MVGVDDHRLDGSDKKKKTARPVMEKTVVAVSEKTLDEDHQKQSDALACMTITAQASGYMPKGSFHEAPVVAPDGTLRGPSSDSIRVGGDGDDGQSLDSDQLSNSSNDQSDTSEANLEIVRLHNSDLLPREDLSRNLVGEEKPRGWRSDGDLSLPGDEDGAGQHEGPHRVHTRSSRKLKKKAAKIASKMGQAAINIVKTPMKVSMRKSNQGEEEGTPTFNDREDAPSPLLVTRGDPNTAHAPHGDIRGPGESKDDDKSHNNHSTTQTIPADEMLQIRGGLRRQARRLSVVEEGNGECSTNEFELPVKNGETAKKPGAGLQKKAGNIASKVGKVAVHLVKTPIATVAKRISGQDNGHGQRSSTGQSSGVDDTSNVIGNGRDGTVKRVACRRSPITPTGMVERKYSPPPVGGRSNRGLLSSIGSETSYRMGPMGSLPRVPHMPSLMSMPSLASIGTQDSILSLNSSADTFEGSFVIAGQRRSLGSLPSLASINAQDSVMNLNSSSGTCDSGYSLGTTQHSLRSMPNAVVLGTQESMRHFASSSDSSDSTFSFGGLSQSLANFSNHCPHGGSSDSLMHYHSSAGSSLSLGGTSMRSIGAPDSTMHIYGSFDTADALITSLSLGGGEAKELEELAPIMTLNTQDKRWITSKSLASASILASDGRLQSRLAGSTDCSTESDKIDATPSVARRRSSYETEQLRDALAGGFMSGFGASGPGGTLPEIQPLWSLEQHDAAPTMIRRQPSAKEFNLYSSQESLEEDGKTTNPYHRHSTSRRPGNDTDPVLPARSIQPRRRSSKDMIPMPTLMESTGSDAPPMVARRRMSDTRDDMY